MDWLMVKLQHRYLGLEGFKSDFHAFHEVSWGEIWVLAENHSKGKVETSKNKI